MGLDIPLINGNYASYAEIGISLAIPDGPPFETKDIPKISWEDGFEPADVMGTGPYALGQTKGQYKCSASLSMYRAKYAALLKALASVSPTGKASDVSFDVIVIWEPLNGEGELLTCEILGCSIKSRKSDNATGSEGAVVEVDLNPSKIIEHDVEL